MLPAIMLLEFWPKKAPGFDVRGTADYAVWHRQVADMRNDFVKGTRHGATEGEVAAGVAAVHCANKAMVTAAGGAAPTPRL